MPIVQLQLNAAFICAGQFAMIVQHFQIEDPTEPSAFRLARDLAKSFIAPVAGTEMIDTIMACMSTDSYLSSVKARQTSGGGSGYTELFASTDHPGAFSGSLVSQQVAAHIKWVSAAQGGLAGGTFLPGVSSEALDANRFNDAMFSAVTAYINNMVLGIQGTAGTFFPVIRRTVPGPLSFWPIVAGQLSRTAGTIRKRLVPV